MSESPVGLDENRKEPTEEQVTELLDRLDLSDSGNLIGVLQAVQDCFAYLPGSALQQISRRANVPLSRVYGVVTFYAQFYTEPRGRHTVRCCRGTACHVKGAGRIIDAIQQILGIDEGQTTEDMQFSLESVACLGTCFLAPAMMIDNQYYGKLTPQRVQSVLGSYRTGE